MKNKISCIVIIIVVAIATFYAGIKYNQSKTAAVTADRQVQFGQMRNGGQGGAKLGRGGIGMGGAGFVSGEIISKDAQSITVKIGNQRQLAGQPDNATQQGGSKIIFLSASTTIAKTVAGTQSDLSVGSQISVTGNANTDGSVTAKEVQVR